MKYSYDKSKNMHSFDHIDAKSDSDDHIFDSVSYVDHSDKCFICLNDFDGGINGCDYATIEQLKQLIDILRKRSGQWGYDWNEIGDHYFLKVHEDDSGVIIDSVGDGAMWYTVQYTTSELNTIIANLTKVLQTIERNR